MIRRIELRGLNTTPRRWMYRIDDSEWIECAECYIPEHDGDGATMQFAVRDIAALFHVEIRPSDVRLDGRYATWEAKEPTK